jgi:hypothetical protein
MPGGCFFSLNFDSLFDFMIDACLIVSQVVPWYSTVLTLAQWLLNCLTT